MISTTIFTQEAQETHNTTILELLDEAIALANLIKPDKDTRTLTQLYSEAFYSITEASEFYQENLLNPTRYDLDKLKEFPTSLFNTLDSLAVIEVYGNLTTTSITAVIKETINNVLLDYFFLYPATDKYKTDKGSSYLSFLYQPEELDNQANISGRLQQVTSITSVLYNTFDDSNLYPLFVTAFDAPRYLTTRFNGIKDKEINGWGYKGTPKETIIDFLDEIDNITKAMLVIEKYDTTAATVVKVSRGLLDIARSNTVFEFSKYLEEDK